MRACLVSGFGGQELTREAKPTHVPDDIDAGMPLAARSDPRKASSKNSLLCGRAGRGNKLSCDVIAAAATAGVREAEDLVEKQLVQSRRAFDGLRESLDLCGKVGRHEQPSQCTLCWVSF